MKGPNVMQRYHNKPEETAEALRDGWMHSGDVVELDEDGWMGISIFMAPGSWWASRVR